MFARLKYSKNLAAWVFFNKICGEPGMWLYCCFGDMFVEAKHDFGSPIFSVCLSTLNDFYVSPNGKKERFVFALEYWTSDTAPELFAAINSFGNKDHVMVLEQGESFKPYAHEAFWKPVVAWVNDKLANMSQDTLDSYERFKSNAVEYEKQWLEKCRQIGLANIEKYKQMESIRKSAMEREALKPRPAVYNGHFKQENDRAVIEVFGDNYSGKFQHVSGKTWKATVTVLRSGLKYVSTPTFVADHVADPGAAMDEAAEYARVRTKVD